MRGSLLQLSILSGAALAVAPLRPALAGPSEGAFTIVDQVASVELAETTSIYVDGKLLAAFRLGGDGARQRMIVSGAVSDPEAPHRYAICGTITVRPPGQPPETHEVNSTGVITDVAGRQYEALGAADFTFFYLADDAPGRVPVAPSRDRSFLCHPPVS